jgi:hypothetical protein
MKKITLKEVASLNVLKLFYEIDIHFSGAPYNIREIKKRAVPLCPCTYVSKSCNLQTKSRIYNIVLFKKSYL